VPSPVFSPSTIKSKLPFLFHLRPAKNLSYVILPFGDAHARAYQEKIDFSILAVHDCFKHAAGQNILLLDWRQVLSYDVSFLNIRIVVNSATNLVDKNLPRTALQILFLIRSII
jgi:hypothetical protein